MNSRELLRGQMDQARAKELFDYLDGKLIWKERHSQRLAGSEAGWIESNGYRRIRTKEGLFLAHRIVWLWHGRNLPEFLDHIDGDPSNNKIENLRAANKSENGRNCKLHRQNKSGAKGVFWNEQIRKWSVSCRVNGKQRHFGCYEDFELAELVAMEARNKYHGEFARHG